eukprot:scaffold7295_cov167-Amphora_coffeaeformis.AAC.9
MSRLRLLSSRSHHKSTKPFFVKSHHIAAAVLCLSGLYVWASWRYLGSHAPPVVNPVNHENNNSINNNPTSGKGAASAAVAVAVLGNTINNNALPKEDDDTCAFRQYPPHRYYEINAGTQPDFLTSTTEYIYGRWPQILPQTTDPAKLCIDQTEWTTDGGGGSTTFIWPFADGTNPSLLSVDRLRRMSPPSESVQRLLAQLPSQVAWLATACMTNSQCQWKDTEQQIVDYKLSRKSKPDTVRTLLLLLDEQFQKISQSTIYLQLDSAWGKKVKMPQAEQQQQRRLVAFDDARLFVHDGQVWLSYREGPGFGYEAQVLNPLHFEWNGPQLQVAATSSETTFFCCGRNMALMENRQQPSQLLSLTWVDPVTVENINTTAQPVPIPKKRKQQPRRLSEETVQSVVQQQQQHRRLDSQGNKTHKSHIHGTNAFMVYLTQQDAFLGVAHFHRPNDRMKNPYARFGHHYTHAFFTVSAQAPWHLTALSAEFVYPATTTAEDAEVIQFSSGLELTPNGDVALAYGINDCEAAVTTVPWSVVSSLLQPVPAGKEVVAFMQPLTVSK